MRPTPPQGRRDKLQVLLCPLCGMCGGVRLVRVRMETDPHRGYWVLGEVWESESGWHHRGACWDQDGNWALRVHTRLYFLSRSSGVSRMLNS